MRNYAAVIIDVKNSRNMISKDRFFAQEKLFKIVDFINYIYREVLIKQFEFSAGDSIQGLFENSRNAFNAYLFIRNLFYPFELRCGMGFASIENFSSNYLKNLTTNMLDGDAYHLAHEALIECKESDMKFLLYSHYVKDDIIINQIMNTVDLLLKSQTLNQADICNLLNLLYPINYHNLNINIRDYSLFLIDIMKVNGAAYSTFLDKSNVHLYHEVISTIEYATRKNQQDYQNMDFNCHVFNDNLFSPKLDVLVANVLNTSRQNISKMKQSGCVEEIRRLELSTISYLENIYDKENEHL